MNKKLFISIGLILFLNTSLQAETIYLKDGRAVQGKIIYRMTDSVSIIENNSLVKYLLEDIDHIAEDTQEDEARVLVTSEELKKNDEIASKKQLIFQFMALNGVRANMEANLATILEKTPLERREELAGYFNIDEIIELLVPIYDKYYSEEDLSQMVRFYESRVGQKMLSTAPLIMNDTMTVSLEYFKNKVKSP